MSNKPNLFIVGAPKCGTTSLAEYLKGHPGIYFPALKEPHYFASDFAEFRTISNRDEYDRQYSTKDEYRYYGDGSVWYLYSQRAIKAIKEFNGNARIIIMLRDPVSMVQSLHAQLLYTFDENIDDFKTAWELQSERAGGRSIPPKNREPSFLQYFQVAHYAPQIERVYNYFDEEQVKIILFDDFLASTGEVYNDLLSFLNLEAEPEKEFPVKNQRKQHISKKAAQFIHRPPKAVTMFIKAFKKIFRIKELNILNKLDLMNRRKKEKTTISKEFEKELIEVFTPGIQQLEQLLDKDLSNWRSVSEK